MELFNEFTKDYNVTGFIAGNTGAQMGGWFRQELKSLDDIKGLKFRIAGLAGQVIAKLGGVPQQIGGGDIYPALEKGTIDAAEWVGPYDDERLGFYKIAKFYYYPGWWEGNAQLWMYVNLDQWARLPPAYKAVFEAACAETNNWMQAKYDAENPAALRRLVANGAQLRPFSREIMQAAYKASFEVYDEIAGQERRSSRRSTRRGRHSARTSICGSASPRTRSRTSSIPRTQRRRRRPARAETFVVQGWLRVSGAIDRVNELLGRFANVLVLLACLLSAGNAMVRYAYDYSSNGWLEAQWYMFAAMVMFGASYTLKRNEHVRVEIFYLYLNERGQLWLDLIGAMVFLIPVCALLAALSWPFFAQSYAVNEWSSNAGGLPRWPVKFVLAGGLRADRGTGSVRGDQAHRGAAGLRADRRKVRKTDAVIARPVIARSEATKQSPSRRVHANSMRDCRVAALLAMTLVP